MARPESIVLRLNPTTLEVEIVINGAVVGAVDREIVESWATVVASTTGEPRQPRTEAPRRATSGGGSGDTGVSVGIGPGTGEEENPNPLPVPDPVPTPETVAELKEEVLTLEERIVVLEALVAANSPDPNETGIVAAPAPAV